MLGNKKLLTNLRPKSSGVIFSDHKAVKPEINNSKVKGKSQVCVN
jgi:hypothetical protein